MSKRGIFISIEGIEGVGKSTALQFIEEVLEASEIPYVITREPGGTPLAEEIRTLLLHGREKNIDADAELLLMFASRAQHIAEVIKPALVKGHWVISDRFVDASFAYQGGGRGIPLERIAVLSNWLLQGLLPDHTLLLDAPVEVGMQRMQNRGMKDRIEKEGKQFFERVRNSYLQLAKEQKERIKLIRADQELSAVKQHILDVINPLIDKFK